jgi:hypothetical protein
MQWYSCNFYHAVTFHRKTAMNRHLKGFLSTVFLLLAFFTFAQNNEFQKFALVQDSLMTKAYYNKSPKDFISAFNVFNARYNNLSNTEKEIYRNYRVNFLYNLTCTYSIINDRKNAMDYLKRTIDAGYINYAHLQEDRDLDNIREDDEFKKIAQSLREKGDYLYILKNAAQYNLKDSRTLPAFTYQGSDNPNLVALRKAFNLDSIAGKGNEVSKILNLLHWIHNLIPHDGFHNNPPARNAMNMIAVCKRENRGLNCRGLATVLNECYLSLGFKSRFVTCLPKDSLKIDNDCHVINAVYSNTQKKWLWIDPTNDAYVMNEKGDLLSIEEVRERIINSKPLILNPDANWNHQTSTTKQNYLCSYMAKNLYMMECNVSSEYDEETPGSNKIITSITLLPLEYFKQEPFRSEYIKNETNTTYIHYNTNNPALFWQAPGQDNRNLQ